MRLAFLIEPPFSYRSSDGMVTGCDVALARSVLTMASVEALELVETGFAQLLPGLAQGRGA
jgi:polar amino acid transport system substrate-binding protein